MKNNSKRILNYFEICLRHDHSPDVKGTPVAGNHDLPAMKLLTVKGAATVGLVIT